MGAQRAGLAKIRLWAKKNRKIRPKHGSAGTEPERCANPGRVHLLRNHHNHTTEMDFRARKR
jgi:hypothetical protein